MTTGEKRRLDGRGAVVTAEGAGVVANDLVRRFDRPTPTLLAYRDHTTKPPWSLDALAEMVGAAAPGYEGSIHQRCPLTTFEVQK